MLRSALIAACLLLLAQSALSGPALDGNNYRSEGYSTDGIVADYAFFGYVYQEGVPAVGQTVWVVNAAGTDSLICVADHDGRYGNDPLTNVPDFAPVSYTLVPVPNPDPRAMVFTTPEKSAADVRLVVYDLRGRVVDGRLSAGTYVAMVSDRSSVRLATTKFNVLDGQEDASAMTLRILGAQPADASVTRKLARQPDQPLQAIVKIQAEGYQTVHEPVVLLVEGTSIAPIDLQPIVAPHEYRIFGETWNQRALDRVTGTLVIQTHSDGLLHQAGIDTTQQDSFEITLEGYEADEQVSIWVDNGDYTNMSTSVFPRGVVASTNNITRKLHEAPTTTLAQVAISEGLYVYALADSVYENPSFRQGIVSAPIAVIRDYPHQELTYIVYTTNVSTGQPISQLEEEQALYVAQQLHSYNTPRNGHVMVNSDIVTMSTPPSDPIRTLFIYRGEWIGQGNTKLPANQPYFNRATAFVNSWDGVGYLFAEAIEAMRVGDDASGHNWWAVGGEFNSPTLTDIGHDMYHSAFFWSLENPNPLLNK